MTAQTRDTIGRLKAGARPSYAASVDLFDRIKVGDRVTILSPDGTRERTGRAKVKNLHSWSLAFGRGSKEYLATRENVIGVQTPKAGH